jgi:hypothetical protein
MRVFIILIVTDAALLFTETFLMPNKGEFETNARLS